MLSYLWKRNQNYYYRIKVPSDLITLFPCRIIRISLKTADVDAAKVLAANVHRQVQNCFALLRSGAVDADMSGQLVKSLLPSRKRLVVVEAAGELITQSGPTLADLAEAYVVDRSPHWTEKTKLEFECQLKLLVEIMGNKEISGYTRVDCLNARDVLLRLPANFTKRKEFRGMSVAEIAALGLSDRLTTKTVNKYLVLLSSLFKWMQKSGYTAGNVATGLVLPIETTPAEERKAYSLEDIARIKLNLPREDDHPEKYWIPLIALYQGMRLDEICQLHLEDILDAEGLLCFDINDGGERNVKTKASKRVVPIHPKLLELGLLEYVQQRRETGAIQLWGNIKPDKLGDWGKWFGNWYGRFNRKYVTTDPLKVFHSFRHTVANTLKQAGVAESVIAEILGHANSSITTGRYGKRYRPSVLLEALMKLDY